MYYNTEGIISTVVTKWQQELQVALTSTSPQIHFMSFISLALSNKFQTLQGREAKTSMCWTPLDARPHYPISFSAHCSDLVVIGLKSFPSWLPEAAMTSEQQSHSSSVFMYNDENSPPLKV